jgi:hypothetical protein
MTSEARRALQVLASALPEGASVPVPREWLLELLSGENETAQTAVASADLTVADLAKRFGRHSSTVRAWLEGGMFPGAYKFMWEPRVACDDGRLGSVRGRTAGGKVTGGEASWHGKDR